MTPRQVAVSTVLVVAVVVSIYILYLIRDVLILMFVGILLATAIAPLVDRLRSRIGRGQAILVIYMGLAITLGLLGYLITTAVIEQISTLATNLPVLITSLQGYASQIQLAPLRGLLLDLLNEIVNTIGPTTPGASNGVAKGFFTATVSILGLGVGFFTVLVIAYYWIIERAAILRLFLSFFPPEQRSIAGGIWHQIESRLGNWVRAQLILMGIVAALFAIGYSIMGLRYALLLAVFAGLAELIPFLGPWIGAAPAILVALSQSLELAIIVAVYSIIIQTIEGNILVLRIMGSTVGISPLVVISALLVGVTLMGMTGAIVAVPIASALQVIVEALIIGRGQAPGPASQGGSVSA